MTDSPELPRPRGWVVPVVGGVASFSTGLLLLWIDWLHTSANRVPGSLTWVAVLLLVSTTTPWIAGAIYQARSDRRLTIVQMPGQKILAHVQQLRERHGDTGVIQILDTAAEGQAALPGGKETEHERR